MTGEFHLEKRDDQGRATMHLVVAPSGTHEGLLLQRNDFYDTGKGIGSQMLLTPEDVEALMQYLAQWLLHGRAIP